MLGGGSIQTESWQAGLQRVDQVLASLGNGLDRLAMGASRVRSLLTADRSASVPHVGPLAYTESLSSVLGQESSEGLSRTSLGRGEPEGVRSVADNSPLWSTVPWERTSANNASASDEREGLKSRLGQLLAIATRLLNLAFEPVHAPSPQAASQETPQRHFPGELSLLDPRDSRSDGKVGVLASSNIDVQGNGFRVANVATRSTLSQWSHVDRVPKLRESLLPVPVTDTRGARPSAQAWQLDKDLAPEFQLDRPEWTRLVGLVSATHEATKRLEAREPTATFG